MKNLDKYKSLLSGEVEGLLLTSRYSRHYAAEFDIAEGVALVSRAGCRYFTDSRYIESAEKNLVGFEVLAVDREHTYTARVNEACADFGVKTLGFEESYLTLEEFRTYEEKLTATLKPCQKAINAFRAQKEPGELRLMEKAQEITDKAFSEVLTRIRVGMTEKELCAELIYCLYKNGADGLSFDPIVVSGPNTSMPHGVPGERVIQEGDFITMDFGVLYEGYCSDMTRTVAVGYVTEEMERVTTPSWPPSWRGLPLPKPAFPAARWTARLARSLQTPAMANTSAMAMATAWAWKFMRPQTAMLPIKLPCPLEQCARQSLASICLGNSVSGLRMWWSSRRAAARFSPTVLRI